MATTYMHRTPSSGGSGTTFTISFWMKRCKISFGNQTPFISHKGGSDYTWLRFNSSDQMEFLGYKGGPETFDLKTTRLFRDTTAWMHICITFDSTESVEADRLKFYVNGVKETDFATSNYPTEDNTMIINDTTAANAVGVGNSGATYLSANNYWDGCLSHFHFIDGTAYQASTFGETDATSGIWKIKTSPTVTYGTNGFFLKMEDRTNLDLDSGTNAFTMTTSGTGTATYDNPSNNFCTMNPLDNYFQGATFSKGNLYTVMSTSNYAWTSGTMPLFAGLWYFETYVDVSVHTDDYLLIGAAPYTANAANAELGTNSAFLQDLGYYGYGGGYRRGGSVTSYGDSYGDGNYIGTYIDLNAEKIYWSKDGVIQNSGTGVALTAIADTPFGYWLPAMSQYGSGATYSINFGNGYFGTTLIGSPSADEGGIGAFKYDPSAGGASSFDGAAKNFRAICTKNIKLYGAP